MRTFGSLSYSADEHEWRIDPLEPHAAIKLKALFPKIPRWSTAPFIFADRPETCVDLAWFLQRYPLEVTTDLQAHLSAQVQAHLQKQTNLEQLLRPDYTPRTFTLKGALRPYQARAVELYLGNRTLLLGDDVGLGKTLVAIGSFTDARTLPAAIVVQTHLPPQWKEKIEEFTNLRVHVIKKTTPYQLPEADIYIFKYSNLAGWVDTFQLKTFQSAVYDETQELRIEGSQKYRAASVLSQHVQYVLGLTATPIYNYGDEVYNILNVMKSGCLDSKDAFMREWGSGSFDRKISNPVALGTYLRENYLFLRRTREEVGRDLPPVNKIVHTVETDDEALDDIEALARTLAIKVTSGSFLERGQAARELDLMVRQATGVSKAKAVANYVKVLLENGESILLAGWHRDVYDIWLKELSAFKPVLYTGTESPGEKERSKKAFINGDSKLMVISLRSGVGLDGLQARASIVVFGELDWSPGVHEQVIGRLNRDGQTQQVTAIYLVSQDGSDPLMVDLLGLKSSQAREILDPLKPLSTQVADETRIQLLAKQFLEKRSNSL